MKKNIVFMMVFCLMVGLVALVAGCSPKGLQQCSVHGMVTVGGEPVSTGSITFIPEIAADSPISGAVIENGKYTIDKAKGLAVGTHQVRITGMKKTGKMVSIPGISTPTEELVSVISEKYDIQKGGKEVLTATLKKGTNEVNFELDAK